MPVSNISSHAVSISLSAEELPPVLDAEAAKSLIREALEAGGQPVWGDMEVELFTGNGGVLLIARPLMGEPRCFSFDDFERLLSAVLPIQDDFPSALTYMDGLWLLSLRCREEDVPFSLSEFGEPFDEYSENLDLFHSEHGSRLIFRRAIGTLKDRFG